MPVDSALLGYAPLDLKGPLPVRLNSAATATASATRLHTISFMNFQAWNAGCRGWLFTLTFFVTHGDSFADRGVLTRVLRGTAAKAGLLKFHPGMRDGGSAVSAPGQCQFNSTEQVVHTATVGGAK